ncbi:MAG TPA: hypothetical protein VK557_16775, partial [Pyrinomonadaceae bacterium]|nr:hypothetical protein [Pyrinomonadaceae bacterium]
ANGLVLVEQRLNAADEIDDGETAMPEADAGSVVKTLTVRSAMANGIVHAGEQFAIDLRAITPNNACYATHLNRLMKSKAEDAENQGHGRLVRDYPVNMTF